MNLSRYIYRPAKVTITEDDDLTAVVDISGYEVIGIVTPDTLTGGGTLDIDLEINPGNGSFYRVMNSAGTEAGQFANVDVDEMLLRPQLASNNPQVPIVGTQVRLALSAAQAADRAFLVLLVALPGSAD